jgi:hypothetical protein
MYWHIRDLWGPANLVTSIVAELYDTLPYLQDVHGIVCGPPMDACQGITWKACTRVRWALLDSSIVVMNCDHLWCLHESHMSCCQVLSLARLYIDLNLCDTLGYEWDLIVMFKCSNATSLCLLWELWGWCWLLCSQDMIIIKCWLSYLACLAYVANIFILINLTWLITYLKVIRGSC